MARGKLPGWVIELEINIIHNGNALDVQKAFPDKSIDMCMTSPPYWGLRDYGTEGYVWDGDDNCEHDWGECETEHDNLRFRATKDTVVGSDKNPEIRKGKEYSGGNFCLKCNAWKGQLGLEPTPDLYIKHICDIFDETHRVLKDGGSLWVNIADTYSSSPVGRFTGGGKEFTGRNMAGIETSGSLDKTKAGIPAKSLIGIPERFVIEMANRGWIRRNTIIWHKPNCMPSSAKDRFTVDFEYVYFFTKNKKYYFEQQLEPWTDQRKSDVDRALDGNYRYKGKHKEGYDKATTRNNHLNANATGQPIGNPLKGRNKRCVWKITLKPFKGAHFAVFPPELCETPIKAGCPVDGIVLDPFFGAGTLGVVATKLGRNYVGIELNPEYIKIAKERLKEVQSSLEGFE